MGKPVVEVYIPAIAATTAQGAPIYVSLEVWHEVEDMTEALRKMQEEGSHTEESGEEEAS